mmetsp:Transcript_4111/g.5453  ORF Transcript_4111/g.5453 Transcript_4111/m.5453 type:complete len:845 (+) Transcript_4111:1-2535(+)
MKVAHLRPIKDCESVQWYLMATVKADLDALAEELNSGPESAAMFMHAVLHQMSKLVDEDVPEYTLMDDASRCAFEKKFHSLVIVPVYGDKQKVREGEQPPGVARLQKKSKTNVIPALQFLGRQQPSATSWASQVTGTVRSQLLPHLLRPALQPSPDWIWGQLDRVPSNQLQILRMAIAGPLDKDLDSWPTNGDLHHAACLAWILPFMQFVRKLEGGKMTLEYARRTSIETWISELPNGHSKEAWKKFKAFEAGWNVTAGMGVRDACQEVWFPKMSSSCPLAIACPVVDPPAMPAVSVIHIDNKGSAPEHFAALFLHEAALKHNRVLTKAAHYMSSELSSHCLASLHPSTKNLIERDRNPSHVDLLVTRKKTAASNRAFDEAAFVQDATVLDLLVIPSSVSMSLDLDEDGETDKNEGVHPPWKMDLGIPNLLLANYAAPWAANCPSYGRHHFEAMEDQLVQFLLAGRRPLKTSKSDHTQMSHAIVSFPFRFYHGSVNVDVIAALVDKSVVPQKTLLQAMGSITSCRRLESLLFSDYACAVETSHVTTDIIPILLGARNSLPCQDEITIGEFVELCSHAGRSIMQNCSISIHPDALERVFKYPDVAKVPLSGLVALHLLARDLVTLSEGIALRALDGSIFEGKELSCKEKCDLDKVVEQAGENPENLNITSRLLARCMYMSSAVLPLGTDIIKKESQSKRHGRSLQEVCEEMDVLEDVKDSNRVMALEMCLPSDFSHWNNASYGHTVQVFQAYRQAWKRIIGPKLKPPPASIHSFPILAGSSSGLIRPNFVHHEAQDPMIDEEQETWKTEADWVIVSEDDEDYDSAEEEENVCSSRSNGARVFRGF